MGGTRTTVPILAPRTRGDLRSWIAADLAVHGLGEWRARYRTTRPVVHYQLLRRRAEYRRHGTDLRGADATNAALASLLEAQARRAGLQLGLDVPLGTAGPGLRLVGSAAGASSGITVDPDARLGAHCILHPGSALRAVDGRAATMGEYGELGAGAVVLGARLGDRVSVAAGSVVTADAGDDVHLAGDPAAPVELAPPPPRRDGRHTTMTPEQVRTARRLCADGHLDRAAIADAFWVSPATLEAYLVEVDAPPRAS